MVCSRPILAIAAVAASCLFPYLAEATEYKFFWEGQIAGFSIQGRFSFDENQSFTDGVVREEDLQSFDITFFDPAGNTLKTYLDNHLTFPEFNFAFNTNTQEILQDGVFTDPDGLNVGEKTEVATDSFTGLNLWSRSKPTSSPLMHVDDWSDEFSFPIGYSTHEDIAYYTQTTQQLIDTGKVGATYIGQTNFGFNKIGQRISVTLVPEPTSIGLVLIWAGGLLLFRRPYR